MTSSTMNEERIQSLIVGDATTDDSSVITISTNTLKFLQLRHGDIVLVAKDQSKNATLIVLVDDSVDDNFVSISDVARYNLGINTGDCVTVYACPEVKFAEQVFVFAPVESLGRITGSLFDDFLAPYFSESYRPIQRGDWFTCRTEREDISFEVTDVQPSERAIVGQHTVLHWSMDTSTCTDSSFGGACRFLEKCKGLYSYLHELNRGGKICIGRVYRRLWQRKDIRGQPESSSVECLIDHCDGVDVKTQEKEAT